MVHPQGPGWAGPGGRTAGPAQPAPVRRPHHLSGDETALGTLSEILDQPQFTAGARFGLAALVVATVVGLAWRRLARLAPGRGSAPVAGLLVVGAAAAGLSTAPKVDLPSNLAVGLLVLAVAGLVDDLAPVPSAVRLLLPVPGAWILATRAGVPPIGWIEVLVGVSVVLAGWLVADLDLAYRRESLGPVLMAISVGGVYLTVPDTEQALVLLGATLLVVPAAWPGRLVALGSGGAFALTGLFVWTVALGGRGRHTAIIGGIACLGLFAAEPVVRRVVGGRSDSRPFAFGAAWWAALPVAALHGAVVLFGSRVVGLRTTISTALMLAAAEAVAALGVALALGRAARTRRSRGP